MTKVLIINYAFPPMPGIGGRRWAKFSKYLAKSGCEVYVLGLDKENLKDSIWKDDVTNDIKYFPIKNALFSFHHLNPTSLFAKIKYQIAKMFLQLITSDNYFDKSNGCLNNFYKQAKKLIKENKINNLIITIAPNHLVKVGIRLKKEFSNLNFIYDIRDPWNICNDDWDQKHLNEATKKNELKLELSAAKLADRVMSVYEIVTNFYKDEVPELFIYKGFDMQFALEKELFWGQYESNSLNFALEKFRNSGNKVISCHKRKKSHSYIALLKRLFVGKNIYPAIEIPIGAKISSEVVAFRINKSELIEMFGDLLLKMPAHSFLTFQNQESNDREKLLKSLKEVSNLNFKCKAKLSSKAIIPFAIRIQLLFLKEDLDFKNVLIASVYKLLWHFEQYSTLADFGVRKLFFAAAENEGEGNVAAHVMRRVGGKTFNYMNGAKARDPHNIHSYFDCWFMPNEATRNLILSFCDVESKNLPVVGHLLEEKAHKHIYSGSLDNILKKFKDSLIITLFTSPIYVEEQIHVINELKLFLKERGDCVVLVRRHPSDNNEWSFGSSQFFEIPLTKNASSLVTLFDILSKSKISITFASTVSLQSRWFGVSTLNVEFRLEPTLPYISSYGILHVSSDEQFRKLINQELKRENIDKPPTGNSASQEILSIIIQ